MSWFERVRRAGAGQRVTRADRQQAADTLAELTAINAERERLLRDGLAGVATIVGIRENVATTSLGRWHELELDVQLSGQDPYRATRRVALELSSAPHIAIDAQVPIRVDPRDYSKVLVVAPL
ncbi:hypothetical protein AO501_15490 [Mycobacterium gordonae]|uniref:Uncharacterized protein n=1 Tax=Mycobacterium gordonae TaxID=1778 RepID=A0A0Q2QKQ4_MYCGO|nr:MULTISPECIES: hypothetical protein [Mycobacterium]KQH80405.1 hypothetical protein AO501_15490 [Mycobacterium gordonae]MDP7727973.1 hypothetical protein [Mycobacterium sp. TY813]